MSRRRDRGGVHGLILIDKPSGITSFDVVGRLRKLFGTRRIGHTGTLDPLATGLMAVLLGQATKLAPFITATRKAYTATVRLGVTTDTYDAEGQITSEADNSAIERLDRQSVLSQLEHFRGQITQRPPAFSAIKVDGERLYARARRGEEVVVPERDVEVFALVLERFSSPELELSIECSKGTYIRSVAHDLGQRLEVGAHLSALRRTAVGTYRIDDAWRLETLENMPREQRLSTLRPLGDAVAHLPGFTLSDVQVKDVRHGKRFTVDCEPGPHIRALCPQGTLVAIVEVTENRELRVVRGIPAESSTT